MIRLVLWLAGKFACQAHFSQSIAYLQVALGDANRFIKGFDNVGFESKSW